MGERTIVEMVYGSHVYGTNTPLSDLDLKAVFIPDGREILLQRATKVSRNRSTGDSKGKNTSADVDREEFSLHGFLKLLCEGQTIAIDMLFVPSAHFKVATKLWHDIRDNRGEFVSKSIAPFVGYCRAQANKYGIKGSRMAAAKLIAQALRHIADIHPRTRLGDFPTTLELLRAQEHVEFVDKVHPHSGATVTHLSVCNRLAPFTLRIEEAAAMYEKLWTRYGERARAAMQNENIDWKALMHARRVQDQAIELLSTGNITFPRPNAKELLAIRLGQRSYVDVANEIEQGLEQLESAMEASLLPDKPNRHFAEEIITEAYAIAVRESRLA